MQWAPNAIADCLGADSVDDVVLLLYLYGFPLY